MARIRSVKPEFFKHEDLQDLENANPGQHVMLVYAGLWTQCDKNGVFQCKARVIKNEILPYVDFDMQKTLDILEAGGYFIKYRSGGRDYGYVSKFKKYQYPGKAEKDSPAKYPEPPAETVSTGLFQGATADGPEPPHDCPETVSEPFYDGCGAGSDPEGIQEYRIKGIQEYRKKESGNSGELPPLSESQIQAAELSTLLLTSHRKEIPDYLSGKDDKKTVERWARDIETLIRIDKKPPETIRRVILWVKTPGNFWFPNIGSGKKLREKFETLYSQMLRDGGVFKHRIKNDNASKDDVTKYFRRI